MKNLKKYILVLLIIPLFTLGQNPKTIEPKDLYKDIYENPDKSLNLATKLLEKEKNSDKRIEILMVMSTANIAKRDYDESLKNILEAKAEIKDNTNATMKMNVLISIAIQYQQMELFSKSLETLEEDDEFAKRIHDNDPLKHALLGKIYAIRGMIYKSQQNPELALQKFQIAENNLLKSKSTHMKNANLSVVLYNMGYCYIDMNRYAESKNYFLKSAEYAKKAEAKSLEAFALKGLGDMYRLSGFYNESLQNLQNAELLSRNVGDLVLNEGIYRGMADNYLALNQLDQYKIYNKKYIEMRFKKEQRELNSINSSIDNQNKEYAKKVKLLNSKYRKIFLIIGGLGLLIAISLILTILKRKKFNLELRGKIQGMMQE